MKKVALVFVLAVFAPSLVLAWLAVRSLRNEQFLLERQQSLLYQGIADALAAKVQDTVADHQHDFVLKVAAWLRDSDARALARSFDSQLCKDWPLAQVGFAVTTTGDMLAPSPQGRPEARLFCADNGRFLANRESVEVYSNFKQVANGDQALRNVYPQRQADVFNNILPSRYKQQQPPRLAVPPVTNAPAQPSVQARGEPNARANQQAQAAPTPNPPPQQQVGSAQVLSLAEDNPQPISKIAPSEAEFRQLIGDDNEGTVARFVDNKLSVLFWYRPPLNPDYVFGAQLALPRLTRELQAVVEAIEPALQEEICVALLDDTAKPVALSHPGFHAAWRRPFVATEIGETLPHWEVAVYLLNPAKLTQSAQTLKLTLGLLIGVLLLAIGVGSWLIVADLNRQLALARQKTDFVSNVSHELKTPLTSIRMFSELLAAGSITDQAKQRSYLGIITAETARLTRLINNVLDFARLERGEKSYSFQPCDLAALVRETADTYRPHLEANGFHFACELPESPVLVNGDRDALAQVVVNLLSNAEKYSDTRKEIAVSLSAVGTRSAGSVTLPQHDGARDTTSPPSPAAQESSESCERSPLSPSEGERAGMRGPSSPLAPRVHEALAGRGARAWVEIKVLDRGLGVPAGCGEKIFEQFYRAHDSLSNGIQGSGLGLTLARQIARAHGGDVLYEPRAGGGSCFTLRLPVMTSET